MSFANVIGEILEFAGRDDETIWACGRRNHTAALPSPGLLDEPDERLVEGLSGWARRWLGWRCSCVEKHADGDHKCYGCRSTLFTMETLLPSNYE